MPLLEDNAFLEPKAVRPINQASIERFLRFCTLRHYPKKGVVVRPGELADSLFYLIKGSASVLVHDEESGNEIVLGYINPGDFIGEIGLFYRSKHRVALVRTRTPCELAEIGYERLEQLFKTDLKDQEADILRAVGSQLTQRLLKTTRRVTQLVHMDVSGRIARTLLDLCQEPHAMSHPEGTQIHISRQELGRMVGASRETVGRVLRQMADEGMIHVEGMDITVYHSR